MVCLGNEQRSFGDFGDYIQWFSEEAIQIAVKRRDMKGREKERYTHLNAEIQRIAFLTDRDKAFLTDQCKQIKESNRIGKTGDLLKRIRDTNGTFRAKMGTIKDRNGMDLIEVQHTKMR